jgi:FkbM family methyltransferase
MSDSILKKIARLLFWGLAPAGRRFGGVRPRRVIHWLARWAFPVPPQESEFRWFCDRWGDHLLLHPYFFLDRQIIAFGAYDYPLHALIEQRVSEGMVCLDIGANIGAVSLHLAHRAGLSGLVYCFEPLPHLYKRLSRNIDRHPFRATFKQCRIALAAQDGETILSAAAYDDPNQGMGSIVNQDACLKNRFKVPTVSLDTFAKSEGLSRIDFLKIDVQGAEPLVIAGATRVLRRDHPEILVEISAWDLKAGGSSGPKLLATLEGLGYDCFRLTRSGQIGRRVRSADIDEGFSCDNLYCRCAKS